MSHQPNSHRSYQGAAKPAAARLPVAKAEDVEFSKELADEADLAALERAQAADQRAEQS